MNWKLIIKELHAAGFNNAQIGAAIGTSGSAIKEIVMGRTRAPRYDTATKLLALHKRRKHRKAA